MGEREGGGGGTNLSESATQGLPRGVREQRQHLRGDQVDAGPQSSLFLSLRGLGVPPFNPWQSLGTYLVVGEGVRAGERGRRAIWAPRVLEQHRSQLKAGPLSAHVQ